MLNEDLMRTLLRELEDASLRSPSIMSGKVMQILEAHGTAAAAEVVAGWGRSHNDCFGLFCMGFALHLGNVRGDRAVTEFSDALGKVAKELNSMTVSEKQEWLKMCLLDNIDS